MHTKVHCFAGSGNAWRLKCGEIVPHGASHCTDTTSEKFSLAREGFSAAGVGYTERQHDGASPRPEDYRKCSIASAPLKQTRGPGSFAGRVCASSCTRNLCSFFFCCWRGL